MHNAHDQGIMWRRLALSLLSTVATACSMGEAARPDLQPQDAAFTVQDAPVQEDAPEQDGGVDGAGVTPDAVQAIFDRSCGGSKCHIGTAPPQEGLNLSAGVSRVNLVSVASSEDPTRRRVEPGHPESSYMFCKIDPSCSGTDGGIHGDPMPLGGTLAAADIETIRAWIASLPAGDKTPPAFAGIDTAAASGEKSAVVTWKPATDGVTPASGIVYHVYVGTASKGEDFTMPVVTVTGVTTATVPGLMAKHDYYFAVRAEDAAGNAESNVAERMVTTLDTTAPTFLGVTSVTVASPTSVTLSWAAATDNVDAPSAIHYEVYSSTTSSAENFASPVLTTAAGITTVTVGGLASGTSYFFVVRAADTSNNEDTNRIELTSRRTRWR